MNVAITIATCITLIGCNRCVCLIVSISPYLLVTVCMSVVVVTIITYCVYISHPVSVLLLVDV